MHFESKVDLCHKSNIEYRSRPIGLLDFRFTVRYTRCNLPISLKPPDLTLRIR